MILSSSTSYKWLGASQICKNIEGGDYSRVLLANNPPGWLRFVRFISNYFEYAIYQSRCFLISASIICSNLKGKWYQLPIRGLILSHALAQRLRSRPPTPKKSDIWVVLAVWWRSAFAVTQWRGYALSRSEALHDRSQAQRRRNQKLSPIKLPMNWALISPTVH